jgi:hypothetical protein
MPESHFDVGESFPVQFAWKLPNGDFLRAVFEAEVLDLVPAADKYMIRLQKLVAGRQDDSKGVTRPQEEFSKAYWAMVGKLIGNKVSVAYEVDDGRALHMRFETLTGEHNFFTRYEKIDAVTEKVAKLLEERQQDKP